MLIQLFFQCAILIIIYMSSVFIIAHIKQNNSIVDIAWGLGFIAVTFFSLFSNPLFLPRQLLITILITLWGLRISGYILLKNWNKGLDPRYVDLQKNWGRWTPIYSYIYIFMLQGFIMLIIASPIISINNSSNKHLTIIDFFGIGLWLIGFLFEAIGDLQKYIFLKNSSPKNIIMKTGLWRYTRHPNYFGECLIWWGIWLIALSVPYGFISIISPITITLLLLYVSGIPMAEKQMANFPEYAQYKKETNAFIPWFTHQSQDKK